MTVNHRPYDSIKKNLFNEWLENVKNNNLTFINTNYAYKDYITYVMDKNADYIYRVSTFLSKLGNNIKIDKNYSIKQYINQESDDDKKLNISYRYNKYTDFCTKSNIYKFSLSYFYKWLKENE